MPLSVWPTLTLLLVVVVLSPVTTLMCFECQGSDHVYPDCGSKVLASSTSTVRNVTCAGFCEKKTSIKLGAAGYFRKCSPKCQEETVSKYGEDTMTECCNTDFCNGPVKNQPLSCYSCQSQTDDCPEGGLKAGEARTTTCMGYCKKTVEKISYLVGKSVTVSRTCSVTCQESEDHVYGTEGTTTTHCCETHFCNAAGGVRGDGLLLLALGSLGALMLVEIWFP